jgi:hypothetical protein
MAWKIASFYRSQPAPPPDVNLTITASCADSSRVLAAGKKSSEKQWIRGEWT